MMYSLFNICYRVFKIYTVYIALLSLHLLPRCIRCICPQHIHEASLHPNHGEVEWPRSRRLDGRPVKPPLRIAKWHDRIVSVQTGRVRCQVPVQATVERLELGMGLSLRRWRGLWFEQQLLMGILKNF